ncbi:MAG: Rab family GTPase, partial [Candidatus Hodarchaeales archaeon]
MKLILIGDGEVGKTALLNRYVTNVFDSSYKNTIGADCVIHETEIDGQAVKYQIWDLAGQPKYDGVRSIYYGGTLGIILVYDITRKDTYKNTVKWIEEAFINTGIGPVPVALLANKTDLSSEVSDTLARNDGIILANEINRITANTCTFYETSAKTGMNVDRVFNDLG